jgi:hypothetical protein
MNDQQTSSTQHFSLSPTIPEARIIGRIRKLRAWFAYLDDVYADVLSRPSEFASPSGFDPEPDVRPCEHHANWKRGKLCLACDNTGWRPLTRREREEAAGIDPYSAQTSKGITIVRDESPASRRARASERIDADIAVLTRNERIRRGSELPETREGRLFRIHNEKLRHAHWLLVALRRMKHERPHLRGEAALRWLAFNTPGRIPDPPLVYEVPADVRGKGVDADVRAETATHELAVADLIDHEAAYDDPAAAVPDGDELYGEEDKAGQ